jgi:predicted Zn-dependent peptidase
MEKNVILEEIGMYRDRPFWVAYEQTMEKFCGAHPLGYRILGTPESITALKRDQMADYFNDRYSPDNMVVALSGKLDFDRTVDQINTLCGSWQRTGTQRDYPTCQPQPSEQTLKQASQTRHYVVCMTPGPSRQDEARYAASVLSNLLGDADGSRLYWKLIDPGLADEADLTFQPFDQFGSFMSYASCDPQRAEEVEAALMQILASAADDLTDAEVERSRNKIAVDLMLHNERPAGRMMALGAGWLSTGEYRSLEEELHRVEAVTTNDLRDFLKRWPFEPRTVVRLTPGE